MHKTTPFLWFSLLLLSCSGQTETAADDTTTPPLKASEIIVFGLSPSQTISKAPFPNDLYLNAAGRVEMGPLVDDPLLAPLGKSSVLKTLSAHIANRTGFSFSSAIYFFMQAPPNLATFEGKVHLTALSGPEAGKAIPVQVFWFEPAQALGVFPKWGHYMMADSTYALTIGAGVTTAEGLEIERAANLEKLLSPTTSLTDTNVVAARARYAALRDALVNDPPDDPVVAATVFTTEKVFEHGRKVIDAVDGFTLEPPTSRVFYDSETETYTRAGLVQEEALEAFFGTPKEPYLYNPGLWGSNRKRAEELGDGGQFYTGGTGHFGVEAIISGSIVTPALNLTKMDAGVVNTAFVFENDAITSTQKYMVPFTLFLCEGQRQAPGNLPVAIFNHGGGALRSDGAAMANANCLAGVATIALDMIYHGNRRKTHWLPDDNLVVPTEIDIFNFFSGLKEGEEGYVTDYIGDPGSSAASVAPLFATEFDLDPLRIEANLLQVTADTYTLVRYLKSGNWDPLLPGLSFNKDLIFHNAISFGTCFNTAIDALIDDFKGIVNTVGTGQVLSVNMPMGPNNALQAAGILFLSLGLKTLPDELHDHSYQDPVVALHQWLHERGDPLAWAPYVLRHRQFSKAVPLLSTGNSWDETLFNPAQLTFGNALGVVPYSAGKDWTLDPTVPGSASVDATALTEPLTGGNVEYGGKTNTAAIFYWSTACHALMVTALCTENWVHPYPPLTNREESIVAMSPICAVHQQYGTFTKSLVDGNAQPVVTVPGGDCKSVYGP